MTQIWYHPELDRIVTRKVSQDRWGKTVTIKWREAFHTDLPPITSAEKCSTDNSMWSGGWKKLGTLELEIKSTEEK